MTNSGAGGDLPRLPTPDEQAAADAEIADLRKQFPRGWDFAWTMYPEGMRFVAKRFPPSGEPYVVNAKASVVTAGVKLRQAPQGNSR